MARDSRAEWVKSDIVLAEETKIRDDLGVDS